MVKQIQKCANILLLIALLSGSSVDAFTPLSPSQSFKRSCSTKLQMGLDLVTYLRTEYISAALCTNQTPRSADVCLQLGTGDGRAVTFIPRTIRKLITSTVPKSDENDNTLSVSVQRQLTQQRRRRGTDLEIVMSGQPCFDLYDTDDESVDVVISLQTAAQIAENNYDWKKSVQEATRVLKPGGRFLFVEQTTLDGVDYLKYLENLGSVVKGSNPEEEEVVSVFSEIGTDNVDLVLVPHIAGIAIKSEDAGLTKQEREAKKKKEEQDRYAELSLSAFERGSRKKRKRKKKLGDDTEEVEGTA